MCKVCSGRYCEEINQGMEQNVMKDDGGTFLTMRLGQVVKDTRAHSAESRKCCAVSWKAGKAQCGADSSVDGVVQTVAWIGVRGTVALWSEQQPGLASQE